VKRRMGLLAAGGAVGQTATCVVQTSALTMQNANTDFTLVPGLADTVTFTATSIVYVSADGGAYTTSVDTNGFSAIDVALAVDGNVGNQYAGPAEPLTMVNNDGVVEAGTEWSLSIALVLPAGPYTFQVAAKSQDIGGASAAQVGADNGTSARELYRYSCCRPL